MNVAARTLVTTMAIVVPACVLAAPPPGASACLGCHPVATNGPVVSLSTLTSEQLETAMQAFRAGTRPATVMDRIAKGFSDDEVRAIAQWYASAKAK